MRLFHTRSHHTIAAIIVFGALTSVATAQTATGPLAASVDNPRCFANPSGEVVLLTGSHTWHNLTDMGATDPPPAFDFDAFLTWLEGYGHNFIRMWRWELTTWDALYVDPHPWPRTGPGTALDGKPKFDLSQFNQDYFDRMRTRVQAAGTRGFYVSVMLFEGWGLQFASGAWESHPFNPANNINASMSVLAGETDARTLHTLTYPAVTAVQEAYVNKVIDTVNDLDNVLYEIANESFPGSTAWQYQMINYVRAYQQAKAQQHPIGMTFQYTGGDNQTLFDSPADWISPNYADGYRDNPPANDGTKVILSDTDHLWGIGGDQLWVWKSFTRGINPIFMDPYDGIVLGSPFNSIWNPIRESMGYALSYARRIDLNNMHPNNALASTTYCLANPGDEYLAYLPTGGQINMDLSAVSGLVTVEWFNPNTNTTTNAGTTTAGPARIFNSPFGTDDAVLYLKATTSATLGVGAPFFTKR